MEKNCKTIIINGKVSIDEKKLIEQASKLERRTISSFLIKASLDRALEIINKKEVKC